MSIRPRSRGRLRLTLMVAGVLPALLVLAFALKVALMLQGNAAGRDAFDRGDYENCRLWHAELEAMVQQTILRDLPVEQIGVRFTDGYSSACVCSPARVGLQYGPDTYPFVNRTPFAALIRRPFAAPVSTSWSATSTAISQTSPRRSTSASPPVPRVSPRSPTSSTAGGTSWPGAPRTGPCAARNFGLFPRRPRAFP